MISVVLVERRITKAIFRRAYFVVSVRVRGMDGLKDASTGVRIDFLVRNHILRCFIMPVRVQMGM